MYENDKTDAYSLPVNNIRAVAEDKLGNLWVGTSTGLSRLKPDGSGFIHHGFASGAEINCIAGDDEGLLWVGGYNGLYVYNLQADTYSLFTHEYRNPQSLSGKPVRCIYIDKHGIYWFGTSQGGICKYDKNLNLFNLTSSSSFQENRTNIALITALAENKNGHVLMGTNGNGLYEYDRKKEQVYPVNLPVEKHPSQFPVYPGPSAHAKRQSLYWRVFPGRYHRADRQSGSYKQLVKGPGQNDLTSNDIFCLFEDSKGNIWIGTNGDGTIVMNNDRVTARFSPLPKSSGVVQLPINGYIRAIGEDALGNIWIGTHGGGIAVYEPATR